MKKIIITETDNGVIVEQLCKKNAGWKPLDLDDEETTIDDIMGFKRIYRMGIREIMMSHVNAGKKLKRRPNNGR